MTIVLRVFTLMFLLAPYLAWANENPLSAQNKRIYSVLQKMILISAEKLSEADYAFKPVESVRSYGQILGHVADSQYYFCSVALGAKSPRPNVEKTKTSKADLIAALHESFAYCGKAYDAMNDEVAVETVKFMGGDSPKLGVLWINNTHTAEHYGNLVTYMRMKGHVPPTSDPEFMKAARE